MINKIDKNEERLRRTRTRAQKDKRNGGMPRLSVYRSLNHIYVQLIDDVKGVTLCSASTMEKDVQGKDKQNDQARTQPRK